MLFFSCQYAHGNNEKRPIPRHPKYKTEACQSYHKTGYCPYGPRCHFIHSAQDENNLSGNNQTSTTPTKILSKTQQTMFPEQNFLKTIHQPLNVTQSVGNINTDFNNVRIFFYKKKF